MSTAVDEETCRACGSGFVIGMERVHMSNGGVYHTGCADGAYEYERGKMHSRDDLEMSQRHCRDLQRQIDAARRDAATLRRALVATHKLIVEAALTGFNPTNGDWAERLFTNQGAIHAALTRNPEPI